MFGYIRPLRDELRVRDNELYEALYCGICRDLRLRYGGIASAALSYDLVFLTVLGAGLSGKRPAGVKRRCPAHPIKGKTCAGCGGASGTSYASDCGVILAYAKLTDDLRDRVFLPKLRAAALLPLLHGHYTKAAKARPAAARAVKKCMEEQKRAEKGSIRSLDRLSEPSAAMLSALFRELGGYDPDLRVLLAELGYMLGRYIYICDALDDLDKDIKSGDVNPFAPAGAKTVTATVRERAASEAEEAVNLTLGQLGGIYSRLPENVRTPLADNIIYSGLRSVFGDMLRKTRRQSLGGR